MMSLAIARRHKNGHPEGTGEGGIESYEGHGSHDHTENDNGAAAGELGRQLSRFKQLMMAASFSKGDEDNFHPAEMPAEELSDDHKVSPDSVSSVMDAETLMGKLPMESGILSECIIKKLSQGSKWIELRLVLTRSRMVFTSIGSDAMKDFVALHEVVRVKYADAQDVREFDGLNFKEGPRDFVVLEVRTCEDGYNGGRSYVLWFADQDMGHTWKQLLDKATVTARSKALAASSTALQRFQTRARNLYNSDVMQIAVALLIGANFLMNVVQTEVLPAGADDESSLTGRIFVYVDVFFSLTFAAELLLNLAANWMWDFITSGWCMFDAIVVAISIVSFFFATLPGVKSLRILRAFRVMRLFGRLQSLRRIITALTESIVPVANAFLIMMLVTSIYAILSVNLYRELNVEQFGTFSRALFTLFQVCTGDGWASDIARPLFNRAAGESAVITDETRGDGENETRGAGVDGKTAIFFISFIVIVGWTLLQVVVAVLLDNFTAASDREKERTAREKSKSEGRAVVRSAIDPLLAALAHFDTQADLTERILLLFRVLDADESGLLSYEELKIGLQKLRVFPPIRLSEHDWEAMTHGVFDDSVPDEQRELGMEEFEEVMRHQLKLYVQRQVANAMVVAGNDSPDRPGTQFFVLKLLLIGLDELLERTKPVARSSNSASQPKGAAARRASDATSSDAIKESGNKRGGGAGGGGVGGGNVGHSGTTRKGAQAAAAVGERLDRLEQSQSEILEGIRYLVARQREAEAKEAKESSLTLRGPATFLRDATSRFTSVGSGVLPIVGGRSSEGQTSKTDQSVPSEAAHLLLPRAAEAPRVPADPGGGGALGDMLRDKARNQRASPGSACSRGVECTSPPALPHFKEFALSSETARARNRAQVGSNTSSLQESPPPLKAPAGLLGGFNDSLQGMALPGLQNFADNYSTMFTSAFPTGSTTASRPV